MGKVMDCVVETQLKDIQCNLLQSLEALFSW